MSDEFDLDVRVTQQAVGAQPAGILTFGTTCWSCGRPSCGGSYIDPNGGSKCLGTCGGYSSCYH